MQGSYASGKCQGNLIFFKVRELSGNFMLCQGKIIFAKMSGKCQGILQYPICNVSNDEKQKIVRAGFLTF